MWWLTRRNPKDAIQPESVRYVLRYCDVAVVGRIERSSKDTEAEGNYAGPVSNPTHSSV